jgi:hypothetical protein
LEVQNVNELPLWALSTAQYRVFSWFVQVDCSEPAFAKHAESSEIALVKAATASSVCRRQD